MLIEKQKLYWTLLVHSKLHKKSSSNEIYSYSKSTKNTKKIENAIKILIFILKKLEITLKVK